jgi:hypothetical protein
MPGFSQPGHPDAPEVRLGAVASGGRAPAIMAVVEPPVRIAFGEDGMLVEDGPAQAPALRVSGAAAGPGRAARLAPGGRGPKDARVSQRLDAVVRIRLLLLTALLFAASATVAWGLQLHYPPQETQLLAACDTAAANITSAVADASRTQAQTIETRLRVLKPDNIAGFIAFGRPGSNITLMPGAVQAARWNFNCGHGESTGRLGAGPGPKHGQIVSTLHETFTAPGTYTVTFTLNQTGRNVLARLGATERAYRKRHPHGDQLPSIAWAVALHYSPRR